MSTFIIRPCADPCFCLFSGLMTMAKVLIAQRLLRSDRTPDDTTRTRDDLLLFRLGCISWFSWFVFGLVETLVIGRGLQSNGVGVLALWGMSFPIDYALLRSVLGLTVARAALVSTLGNLLPVASLLMLSAVVWGLHALCQAAHR